MSRKKKPKRDQKVGLPPGTAVYVGAPRDDDIHVRAFVYDAQGMQEYQHPTPTDLRALVSHGRVVWLDCDGVHDAGLVAEICTLFGVHPLAVEDVLNTGTRPKLDVFEGPIVLLAVDMVTAAGDPCEVSTEHVSLVLGPGFVLSFQEGHAGDLFDAVRSRIRTGSGRIRGMGPDYLLHALVDAIVDGYFVAVERLEERIDATEAKALDTNTHDLPKLVYSLKSELGQIRRTVFPLREGVSRLAKGEAPIVTRVVEPYFHDLYDHVMQVLDMVDSDRERLNGVLELHLAVQTHKMNDVMKVLTIVATVFIPLSWVAGIYGMNFDFMPELHWAMGYPFALGLMIVMGVGMVGWFRYRGWL